MQAQKSDALAFSFPDLTNVLIARLENWKHVVTIIQDYLDSQISTQKSVSNGLEKTQKQSPIMF